MENEIQLVLKLRAVGNGLFTCKLALLLFIQHAFVKKKKENHEFLNMFRLLLLYKLEMSR